MAIVQSDIILANGDVLNVESGELVNGAIVNSHGRLNVSSGGTATGPTVNSSGRLSVSSGGTALGIVENGGYVIVMNGAEATFAPNTFDELLLKRASATVHSGTTAFHTTITEDGKLIIYSGGTALEIVENGGYVDILDGTDVSFAPNIFNNLKLPNGKSATVHSGTTANNTTVSGSFLVFSGGTANGATVSSNGSVYVYSGGTAKDITINAYGSLYVYSGGTANDIVWTPCEGHVFVEDGGIATFVSEYSGVYFGSNNRLLSNTAVIEGKTIKSSCEMYVMSGGMASNTTVSSGGTAVFSGGMASNTTISSGGTAVFSGGTAGNTTVCSGGTAVFSGGMASNTTVSSGGTAVFSGGTQDMNRILSGGCYFLSSGASATNVVAESGARLELAVSPDTYICFVPDGHYYYDSYSEYIYVIKGIYSSGTSYLPIPMSSAGITVYRGGLATGVQVSSGSILRISSGGVADNVQVKAAPVYDNAGNLVSAGLYVFSGGLANNPTIYGYLGVESGGIALDVKEEGGFVDVQEGAIVTFQSGNLDRIIISGSSAAIHSCTTATRITVRDGGDLFVFSGGTANSTTVDSYGRLDVSSGGIVNSTVLLQQQKTDIAAVLAVSSGGTANDTTVSGYVRMGIFEGGEAYRTVIRNTQGKPFFGVDIFSGGTANDTVVKEYGFLYVNSGGTANRTTVNESGRLDLFSGGTADSTTVRSGGIMVVDDGGTASNIFLDGGSLTISSGGVLAGELTIQSGASIEAVSGSILHFDLTERAGGNVIALVNDLSFVKGSPTYTLTVDDSRTPGIYALADGADDFNSTISVMTTTDEQLCTLSVGESVDVAGIRYSLSLAGGDLSLAIGSDPVPVTVSSGIDLDNETGTAGAGEMHLRAAVSNSGTIIVSSGGTVNSARIETGGSILVSGGGLAKNVIVSSNGCFEVLEDGTANRATVGSDGSINVSGGRVNSTTVSSGGSLAIYDGSVNSTTVSSGGSLAIYDGSVNDTTVSAGGSLTICDGSMNDTTVSAGGILKISGGIASNVRVAPGGWFYVSSGGKLTGQMTFESSAFVSVNENGIIDFDLTQTSPGAEPLLHNLSNLDLSSSSRIYTLTISETTQPGLYRLADNVKTFNKTIEVTNKSGDRLGSLSASSQEKPFNGVLYQLCVYQDVLCVNVGTSGIVLTNKNSRTVRSEETYADVLVENGAVLNVFGTATEIKENGGYVAVVSGRGEASFAPNSFLGVMIEGSATVHSGTTAIRTTVNGPGQLEVYSGGTAAFTVVKPYGKLIVFSGGTAANTTFNVNSYSAAGGSMVVSSGGTALNTIVTLARMLVSSGGTALDTVINSGGMNVSRGAAIINTMVNASGSLEVQSDGTVTNTTVNAGGKLVINNGGSAANTIINSAIDVSTSWGSMVVSRGAMVTNTTINVGRMFVSNGGTATDTTVNSGGSAVFFDDATAINTTVNSSGSAVFRNATATDTTVNSGGSAVFSGEGIIVTNATVNSGGRLLVDCNGGENSGIVNSVTVYSGGSAVFRSATVTDTTVNSGGSAVFSRGKLSGKIALEKGAVVSLYDDAILDFDLTRTSEDAEALVNDLSIIRGMPTYTLTVDSDWTSGSYTYSLAGGAANFNGAIFVRNTAGNTLGRLSVGKTVKIGYDSYSLNLVESTLSLTIDVPDLTPQAPISTPEQVSWEATGANQYIVEYSTDNFEHVIQIVTSASATDMLELPAGTYQWRVKADDNSDWAVGEAIVSELESDTPKVVQAVEDDRDDLFFATPEGTWSNIYYAQHVGSINDWGGTKEVVSAKGKGRIQNLFFGSADPNVLCLTDAENGDGIFVDDVYTVLPEEVEEHTARLYMIQEIRAGAGDDIVDMTSQRFEYIGDGLTIRGGDGDDVIWANKGDNWLFGDDGNDRIVGASGNDVIAGGTGDDSMNGGGGDDVFTFCDNWGADTVEQLETGTVTLWFAFGNESKWDEETLTYTDGKNSVTVSGVSADQITLKFCDMVQFDDSDQYKELSGAGAFDAFTSRKIFEESGSGILA